MNEMTPAGLAPSGRQPLAPIDVASQRDAIEELDAALVRRPIERSDDLHVIPLYDEVTVVVASAATRLTLRAATPPMVRSSLSAINNPPLPAPAAKVSTFSSR